MKKIIFVLILLFILGCSDAKELDDVEIKEYEGKKLDSPRRSGEIGIKGTQYINISDYNLEITGLVSEEKRLSYDEILSEQKYKKAVTLHCVEGWSDTLLWEGILVRDLIDPLEEANTVIFYAYDGYSTALPLSYLYDNDIIMAYKVNEKVLPNENGFPFQLVAEDKYGIKWIKWITKIEVSDDPSYKGYWESRGYDNNADVGGNIFED